MLDLILSTESKVVSTNIQTFEEQANQYLASLTTTFETDDDFAKAKEEVKELKEIETKIRTAIDNVNKGNTDIAALLTTAESIAERFRQERLNRDKLVKTKEAEIKKQITDTAIQEIAETRQSLVKLSDISLALEITMPKSSIAKRLEESQKNKRTIDSLSKAVSVEKAAILSEMSVEIVRLTNRLEQLNSKSSYLFPDAVRLIATQDDLAPIIQQRIEDEQQREAELKAKAEQEAIQAQQAVEAEQNIVKPDEPLSDFIITIRLTQTTQPQAITVARSLKTRFGDCVALNKAK